MFLGLSIFTHHSQAQQVFNDTILFDITRITQSGNDFRYIVSFEPFGNAPTQGISGGIGLISMCACNCDSLWDAWPRPTDEPDSLLSGGKATITYSSSSGSATSGLFGSSSPNRQRGRINIIQMPNSFIREKPFSLPIIFKEN